MTIKGFNRRAIIVSERDEHTESIRHILAQAGIYSSTGVLSIGTPVGIRLDKRRGGIGYNYCDMRYYDKHPERFGRYKRIPAAQFIALHKEV